MSYNIKELFDLYSFAYPPASMGHNSGEFLIGPTYNPLLSATLDNTEVTTILPIKGLTVPFMLESNHTMHFDEQWWGKLARIRQEGQGINSGMIESYMGHKMRLAHREDNMILDGGYITISNRGDLTITSGLCRVDGQLGNFSGLQLQLENQLSSLPKGRGFCVSVYIPSKACTYADGLIIPVVTKTDLISTQVGDYSTMYAVIRSEYGVDFASTEYIEIIRLQMLSQSPSTPYIAAHIDQRMRQPPVDCYPL